RLTLSLGDHAPSGHAFEELALLVFTDLQEAAARYRDAHARAAVLRPAARPPLPTLARAAGPGAAAARPGPGRASRVRPRGLPPLAQRRAGGRGAGADRRAPDRGGADRRTGGTVRAAGAVVGRLRRWGEAVSGGESRRLLRGNRPAAAV